MSEGPRGIFLLYLFIGVKGIAGYHSETHNVSLPSLLTLTLFLFMACNKAQQRLFPAEGLLLGWYPASLAGAALSQTRAGALPVQTRGEPPITLAHTGDPGLSLLPAAALHHVEPPPGSRAEQEALLSTPGPSVQSQQVLGTAGSCHRCHQEAPEQI